VARRVLHKLTPKQVTVASEPRRLSDGGGLYLSVDQHRKRWVFLYALRGRQREMGLGAAGKDGVSLSKARELASAARQQLRDRIDPLEARRADQRARAMTDKACTFGDFADRYIETKRSEWKNDKHVAQWVMTLRDHAAPLRRFQVRDIDTEAVLNTLRPIWQTVPETAQRLRGRIEAILDAAKVKGLREGENPARWRGHLSHLLAKRQKLTRGHHRALPFERVPAFIVELRSRSDVSARLLEFVVLTAARSGEARGAKWSEFDVTGRVWTIPRERMKAGREHRVPLSDRALQIVQELEAIRLSEFAFPSLKGKPYSDMSMTQLLKRMGYAEVATCHGFRSSFKDWASECTGFPNEVSEMALAHAITNEAEAAYRRRTLFEKRRELMEAWARYCGGETNIVSLPIANAV
jgi:integrase